MLHSSQGIRHLPTTMTNPSNLHSTDICSELMEVKFVMRQLPYRVLSKFLDAHY